MEGHEPCRDISSILPSRVVFITGPRNVRLYESNGEIEKYVCLSHCWGNAKLIQTTGSTLQSYKRDIPWKELPLTFQEAISFAFQLGYRYLWIDSLCILQDSAEDWRHEGSRMSQIYSGAHLTIAATASSDGSGGCFRQCERPLTYFSYPAPNGSDLQMAVRCGIEDSSWLNNGLPLLKRAWVFQERLLSQRVIHFLEKELLWECRAKTEHELHVDSDVRMRSFNENGPRALTAILPRDESGMILQWISLITQYTSQNLTFEKDIFSALQGISKQISEHIKSPYLAGLWEIDIISGLLWMSELKERPHEWRAPSWSWASVLGKATWELTGYDRILTPRASCMAHHIEPVASDKFGQLRSGKITLRGQCLDESEEGVFCLITDQNAEIVVYPTTSRGKRPIISFAVDCKDLDGIRPHSAPVVPGQRVKTILMAEFNPYYFFLVLRSVDAKKSTYERFGLIMMYFPESSLNFGNEEIVHII